MATLYGQTVWEAVSTESLPSYEDGARDGHFLKLLDTGESYIRVDGSWEYINLGLAFIKATKSGRVTTDINGEAHVDFVVPLINTEYGIMLTIHYPTDGFGNRNGAVAYKRNLTVDGFDIIVLDTKQGDPFEGLLVSWLATRDYNP